jgi:hypothetical protein
MIETHLDNDRIIRIASAFTVVLTITGLLIGFLFPGKVTGAILPIALTLWWALGKVIERNKR